MLASIKSASVLGIEAYDITVEVDAALGLPQWFIVGLPAGAVKESRERVGAALVNAGFKLPPRRITINLAPADVRKEGTGFDLPIAVGILIATGQLPADAAENRLFAGEVGLDGTVRGIRGALPIAIRAASHHGITLVLPPSNVAEARLVTTLPLCAPATLSELFSWLRRTSLPVPDPPPTTVHVADVLDFADVVGQESAKRAMEVAAAGGHNVLMIGPPGAGKTMLARRMTGILPALTETEALEATAIHSVAGALTAGHALVSSAPFRAPHHSVSNAGLIGGGNPPRPGEVSLAHNGILFLDELLEFPRYVIESLRQPMEDGRVVISRAACTVTFPARFTLVGAMNPCPCGNATEPSRVCICTAADVSKYRAKLSGPLADRIDMHVHVGAVSLRALSSSAGSEESTSIRTRVERARSLQRVRYKLLPGVTCNAHVSGRWLTTNGRIERGARDLLASAAERLALTARGYHRVIRVSRTVADLDNSETIDVAHAAEALRYRPAVAAPGPRLLAMQR
ncbi:MAG: YifB family Mg chelatase-like AAA ATPase [Gemmatimonadaceae bacterium]|nr:YifB family Mg chelatase-like AAA ATPase [Gemmatimonadaceae bacterium]